MKAGGLCFSKTKCPTPMRTPPKRYTVSEEPKKKSSAPFRSLPTHFSSLASIKQIGENIYDTGKFITQDGIKFPIIFDVEHIENKSLDIQINVPKKYKTTPLTKYIRVFGRLIISLDESYINIFYIYPQLYSKLATRYEREAFRGIGKLMLCFGANYIKTDTVSLSAEGGVTCDNEIAIRPYSFEKIRAHFDKYYKDDPDVMYYIERRDIPTLRKAFCRLEKQKSLVKYYGKYGFKITTYEEDGKKILLDTTDENIYTHTKMGIRFVATKMEAKLSDILEYCRKK